LPGNLFLDRSRHNDQCEGTKRISLQVADSLARSGGPKNEQIPTRAAGDSPESALTGLPSSATEATAEVAPTDPGNAATETSNPPGDGTASTEAINEQHRAELWKFELVVRGLVASAGAA
jgi:hypothetical protein